MIQIVAENFVPRPKARPRVVAGRGVHSPTGKDEQALALLLRAGAARLGVALPLDGDLAVDLRIRSPRRLRGDADNYLKAFLDAAQKAGIFANDSQVRDARVRLLPAMPDGWWGTSARFARVGEDEEEDRR